MSFLLLLMILVPFQCYRCKKGSFGSCDHWDNRYAALPRHNAMITYGYYSGVLNSIKKNAPHVKRVVITSSFASILDAAKGNSIPEKTYSETDWNPISQQDAVKNPLNGYRGTSRRFGACKTLIRACSE